MRIHGRSLPLWMIVPVVVALVAGHMIVAYALDVALPATVVTGVLFPIVLNHVGVATAVIGSISIKSRRRLTSNDRAPRSTDLAHAPAAGSVTKDQYRSRADTKSLTIFSRLPVLRDGQRGEHEELHASRDHRDHCRMNKHA
jgi:hypothetical protein